jgi:hypothetical protein
LSSANLWIAENNVRDERNALQSTVDDRPNPSNKDLARSELLPAFGNGRKSSLDKVGNDQPATRLLEWTPSV